MWYCHFCLKVQIVRNNRIWMHLQNYRWQHNLLLLLSIVTAGAKFGCCDQLSLVCSSVSSLWKFQRSLWQHGIQYGGDLQQLRPEWWLKPRMFWWVLFCFLLNLYEVCFLWWVNEAIELVTVWYIKENFNFEGASSFILLFSRKTEILPSLTFCEFFFFYLLRSFYLLY